MIRLENVSKKFKKGQEIIGALENVSLEVPKGSLTLLRGPSGSGKTTLINVAAGLTRPSAGSVWFNRERLDALSDRARTSIRAEAMAVVFQMFHLVPYLTAFENVLLPTMAKPITDAGARAKKLMEDLGIAHRVLHYPGEMSVGERQRCAMARALLGRPKVILADEPTGNLDELSAQQVLQMLNSCRNEGAAILLVSHQPVDEVKPDVELRLVSGKLQP